MEIDMTLLTPYQAQNAIDRITLEIEACHSHIEYFETAFGGDPDTVNVKIFEDKIANLQEDMLDFTEKYLDF
jgi:hypothetical protein